MVHSVRISKSESAMFRLWRKLPWFTQAGSANLSVLHSVGSSADALGRDIDLEMAITESTLFLALQEVPLIHSVSSPHQGPLRQMMTCGGLKDDSLISYGISGSYLLKARRVVSDTMNRFNMLTSPGVSSRCRTKRIRVIPDSPSSYCSQAPTRPFDL